MVCRPEGAGGPPPRAGGRFGGDRYGSDRYGGDRAVRREQQPFGERRGFESKPGVNLLGRSFLPQLHASVHTKALALHIVLMHHQLGQGACATSCEQLCLI